MTHSLSFPLASSSDPYLDLHSNGPSLEGEIFKAIESNNLPDLEDLLSTNSHEKILNQKQENGQTPLSFACALGRHQCVACLVRYGADPTLREHKIGRLTPLQIACTSEDPFEAALPLFLYLPPSLREQILFHQDETLPTALQLAERSGDQDLIDLLKDPEGALDFHFFLSYCEENDLDSLKSLLSSYQARENVAKRMGGIDFRKICDTDHQEIACYLFSLTTFDHKFVFWPFLDTLESDSPLLLAIQHGSIKTCTQLLWAGANCNAKTEEGKTALDLICQDDFETLKPYLPLLPALARDTSFSEMANPLSFDALFSSLYMNEATRPTSISIASTLKNLDRLHWALLVACQNEDADLAIEVLNRIEEDKNFSPPFDQEGNHTLHYACFNYRVLEKIVNKFPHWINIANCLEGTSPFDHAMKQEANNLILDLLEKRTNFSQENYTGEMNLSPLHSPKKPLNRKLNFLEE